MNNNKQHIGEWSNDLRLSLTHFVAWYQEQHQRAPKLYPLNASPPAFNDSFADWRARQV